MECMGKQGYYESWAEGFNGDEENVIEMDDATMESYKDAFTVNKFDEALAEVFPLLHAIMQEAGELDLEDVVTEAQDEDIEVAETDEDKALEFAAFESWATALESGTLEPDALMNLKDFLEQNPEMTLGADGTEAIEALQGVGIVSDALEDLISAKVQMQDGANIPLVDVIGEWLMQDDPEAAQELGLVPQAPEQDPTMAQQAPDQMAPAEEPTAEASDPKHPEYKKKDDYELPPSMRGHGTKDYQKPDYKSHDDRNKRDWQKRSGTGEDHIDQGDEEPLIEKGASNEEIWQAVEGFLDKDKGTWTKGRPGIVAHCNREFGEAGGKKAAKAIMILSKKYPMRDQPEEIDFEHDTKESVYAGSSVVPARVKLEVGKFYLVSDYGGGIFMDPAAGDGVTPSTYDNYDDAREFWGTMHGRAQDEYFISQFDGKNLKPYEEEDEMVEKLDSFEDIMRLAGLLPLAEAEKKRMSRAAKGMMKYGKDGMKALAKAGKEGKDLDKIRDKYNKYKD